MHASALGFGWRSIGWTGALVIGLAGCAKPTVSDLDAYQAIEMNRTAAYPDDEERGKRVFEVAVVDRPSEGLDEGSLRKSRTQLRVGVEKIAASFGAAVIDRSQPGYEGLRTDQPESPFEGLDVEFIRAGDFSISSRFTQHRHQAVYSKPAKLPWQADEDVAKKPGTCVHTAEVGIDVQLVRKGWDDDVTRSFILTHSAKQENKDLDPACTITPVHVETLFETAISEALTCLEIPLGTRVSPRGHVLAHRKSREGETHIYQISLGADQGVDAKEPIEIRRVDESRDAAGRKRRDERVIAKGIATDQITGDETWVAIDPSDAEGEILEGDVVKRVFQRGLINDLTGPNCKLILVER